MATVGARGEVAADDLLQPLVMDVLMFDRDMRRLSGPIGHIDLPLSVRLVLKQLMRRPGTVMAEDKLLAVLFGDCVLAHGAARLKAVMKDVVAAVRFLSRERVRVRREEPAGFVMEMRPAVTKEGRAMLAARAGRSRPASQPHGPRVAWGTDARSWTRPSGARSRKASSPAARAAPRWPGSTTSANQQCRASWRRTG